MLDAYRKFSGVNVYWVRPQETQPSELRVITAAPEERNLVETLNIAEWGKPHHSTKFRGGFYDRDDAATE